MAQIVKNLAAMQETWVLSLGGEDSLEREWQSTPVFLSGKSYGQRRLAGYSPWGCTKLDRLSAGNSIPSLLWHISALQPVPPARHYP